MLKKQPTYTREFKEQIVNLYRSGESAAEIQKEYDISRTSIYSWTHQSKTTGSFKAKDNRSDEENELFRLRKENKQLLHFKASGSDNGTKIAVIRANRHKYTHCCNV